MSETIECSYRAGNISVIKYAECPSTNSRADIEKAIRFLQILLELEYADTPKKLKVPPELQFVAQCLRCGATEKEPLGHHLGCPNAQEERPVQTRRQQLISAGIPAHEFDGIKLHDLDEPADPTPIRSLVNAFVWHDTPQGAYHWKQWESLLN